MDLCKGFSKFFLMWVLALACSQTAFFADSAFARSGSRKQIHAAKSIKDLYRVLYKLGLPEQKQLMVAIDFTESNKWTGEESFGAHLHSLDKGKANPYQRTLTALGSSLYNLDSDAF